jgi:CDP-diacylglycerol--glycerol-3-phosphate 3-phosphatidyltransferase
MSERSFISNETRNRIRGAIAPIGAAMGRAGISPNALTVGGFVGTSAGALAAAGQWWLLAGILVLAFGIFDLFDGAVARATGRVSKFGAFLDSTLDRTGENLALAGVAFGASRAGGPGDLAVPLALLALTFASVVTYTRARAEAVGLKGDIGIAPRPERLVVLSVGLILAGVFGLGSVAGSVALNVALAIIAATSAITVVQRILYVRQQSLDQKEP